MRDALAEPAEEAPPTTVLGTMETHAGSDDFTDIASR
jgi:hypothetical protein